ncbi:MAG: tetratricopeptide repeat protein [Candidatus Sulfotelmatobacter sp.]
MRAETRHQLKQDAFSRVTIATAEKTADWTVAHKSTVIVAGIVVAVLLGAVVGGWYYLSTQDEKAGFDFAVAVRTMNAQLRPAGTPAQPDVPSFTSAKERADAAHKQFQAIADKYPHTRTADMAHYFLGVTAADAGDNTSAERDLKQVAATRNGELASMAKLALASLYGDTNRVKDAVALYQELMKKPTTMVSKATAQLQLADLYEASNQPLDAKRIYEEIKKENPASEAAQLATQKLTDLK